MRSRALLFVFVLLPGASANAQSTWQPSTPPPLTAESTTWFQNAEPIAWNGDYYYPAGAVQGFNQYQMVRSGSFRGIPLYSDTTLEPNSIVFVPLNGGRMQPYERRRSGALAGTTGSRTPSLPTDIAAEGLIPPATHQAPGPPDFARPSEIEEPAGMVAASGESQAAVPVGTSGRVAAAPVTTARPPSGENGIWVEFAGRRWFASGKSIAYDAAKLDRVGSYRGWTVYAPKGDGGTGTIYIPSVPGRLAPYKTR